jgi:hypothetical protein
VVYHVSSDIMVEVLSCAFLSILTTIIVITYTKHNMKIS